MKPENFEERRRLLLRFALFYAVSIGLVVLGFLALGSREPAAPAPNAATASASDKKLVTGLTTELDSARHQVWRLRRDIQIKDSLIELLAMQPVPDIPDYAFERQEIARLQKEQAANKEALEKIKTDSSAMRLELERQRKTEPASKDPVTRSLPVSNVPATTGNSRTTELERQYAQLSDDLRFAQVDCNLSRADAKQVIYNARQRKDLLTDALTTLNQLAKSPDADVQRKARDRMILLRNIASTVHD